MLRDMQFQLGGMLSQWLEGFVKPIPPGTFSSKKRCFFHINTGYKEKLFKVGGDFKTEKMRFFPNFLQDGPFSVLVAYDGQLWMASPKHQVKDPWVRGSWDCIVLFLLFAFHFLFYFLFFFYGLGILVSSLLQEKMVRSTCSSTRWS